ncbi:MAG: hypothetical protein M1840_002010 [Geoglossum simile]|nr:MAG: hypothetical protein M1840_002010 [Geoglossum simile]
MADARRSKTDMWQAVVDHAASFAGVDSGLDEAEVIRRADIVDDNTKAEFIRLDDRPEEEENEFGRGTLRNVVRRSETYSAFRARAARRGDNDLGKWEEYAFLVRRVFDRRGSLICVRVDVQSRCLRDIMKLVFWEKQYTPHFMNHRRISIPTNVLLTRLPELIKLWNRLSNPNFEGAPRYPEHLKLLLNFMQTECASAIASLLDRLKDGVVGYADLSSLFRVGQLLVLEKDGEYQLLRCAEYHQSPYEVQIQAKRVEYDGNDYGVVTDNIAVRKYDGHKMVTELLIRPLSLDPKEDEIRLDLLERGTKYAALRGILHREYKGPIFGATQYTYEGRIVIDHEAHHAVNRRVPGMESLESLSSLCHDIDIDKLGRDDVDDAEGDYLIRPIHDRDEDFVNDERGRDCFVEPAPRYRSRTRSPRGFRTSPGPVMHPSSTARRGRKGEGDGGVGAEDVKLDEEHLMLLPPYIYGFAFADKIYCGFLVRHVRNVEWSHGAFDRVFIPDNHKRLLLAMIQGHKAQREDSELQNDIIDGKGKGLVILLHGPPGVGKTVTVEAVIERTHQPLYIVSAAELGTYPGGLETALRGIFSVAFTWNAVVLIDEADVFLEERSLDFYRSELVAVFLRELEYFQGILIMTTNRLKRFDPAFQSRIHVALKFNDLDEDARLSVWKSALPAGFGVGGDIVRKLAKKEVNGRQIKYCVRTAGLLADQSKEALDASHLYTVLDLAQEFGHELAKEDKSGPLLVSGLVE